MPCRQLLFKMLTVAGDVLPRLFVSLQGFINNEPEHILHYYIE